MFHLSFFGDYNYFKICFNVLFSIKLGKLEKMKTEKAPQFLRLCNYHTSDAGLQGNINNI